MLPTIDAGPRARTIRLWLLALAGLAAAGCEIAEPELPRYQTRLTLPLGEERLDIIDAVDDEDYLIELADGALGFQVDGDPDTVALDFDLGADVDPQSVRGDLGEFTVELAAPTDFQFTLVDLYPEAALLDGLTSPVPGFTFDTASDPQDLPEIQSATLAAGTLTVEVGNGLPVPISADSGAERLVLELVDPGSGTAVATVDFDPIAGGSQATEQADLAGVTLPGALAVRLAGGSPGSGGTPVTVDAQAEIAVQARFSDLQVSEAQAVVGAQEFTAEIATALPADYAVVRAIIAEGALDLTVRNELSIPCQATVTWPEVVDLDDQPLSLVLDLGAGEQVTRTADFAGRIVQAPSGQTLTELSATVAVTSPGSGGQPVPLQADAGLVADLGAGRIDFASVTGTVPELVYDFDPMDEEIDLPNEIEGLLLQRATLELQLTNTAGLNAEAQFHLVGENAAGEVRTLDVQERIAAADADRAAVSVITLDETNSGIVDFLNNLPTAISLAGGVHVGGDGQIGTVRPGDHAVVDWRITSPVEVIVESSSLYGDPEDLDLDTDTRDLVRDHAGAASIVLEVLNHLPVGIETRMLFGPDTLSIKTDPVLAIGPVSVQAGTVDPQSGEVSAPRISRPEIALTATQTQVLATENLYSVIEVILPSTEGNPVRVLTSDYVTVQGVISLDVDVHDPDEDQD